MTIQDARECREIAAAIRVGARLGPQQYGAFVRVLEQHPRTPTIGTCVIGAALLGTEPGQVKTLKLCNRFVYLDVELLRLRGRFPMFHTRHLCPAQYDSHALLFGWLNSVCRPPPATLWTVVTHLNDYHRWSRERIADWVEGLGESGLAESGKTARPRKTRVRVRELVEV